MLDEQKKPVRGSWTMVLEVFAFKQDRLTYDDICIGLRFDGTGSYWWVAEDYLGYSEFLKELNRRFPGFRVDWLSEVAKPPFAEKRTTLWGETWLPKV